MRLRVDVTTRDESEVVYATVEDEDSKAIYFYRVGPKFQQIIDVRGGKTKVIKYETPIDPKQWPLGRLILAIKVAIDRC